MNALVPTEKIWCNGAFIRRGDAHIHVLSHAVSYASSVFEGVRCFDIPVVETPIPREMLYVADEVFLAGTAAEKLQREFFAAARGLRPDRHGWLTAVEVCEAVI